MQRIRRWSASLLVALLLPTSVAHAAAWTITVSGIARTPPGTLSGYTIGQETAAYTWDPAQLTWAVPSYLSEGPVFAAYTGIFNGTESSNHLRAFSFPGTPPHVELIKDAVFNSGPLTATFFTDPHPLTFETNESQLWHNGSEYAWGPAFASFTPVRITVAQTSAALVPEPGTAVLFVTSLLGALVLRRQRRLTKGTPPASGRHAASP